MADGHGGARPGAGRKRKIDKNARAVSRSEKQIRDKLPALIDNLMYLANGGYEQVEEKWAYAVEIVEDKGEKGSKPALDVGRTPELILTERKVSYAAPDRAANIYLINRILGSPTQRQEHAGKDGGDIRIRVVYDDGNDSNAAEITDSSNQQGDEGEADNTPA
jgi:hypothetical protein